MAIVRLRPPLRELAGEREVEVDAGTLLEALRALEREHPQLSGWVLDEQGRLREHVAVFVGAERRRHDGPLPGDARIEIVGAVSGGARPSTQLLVGTRKGLFVLEGDRGAAFEVAHRAFPGQTVEYAIRDPRSGRYLASVTHGQFGPRLFLAEDPTGEWEQAEGPRFPDDVDATLERIWVVTPAVEDGVLYAGVAPAALFRSEDGGRSWELNRGLWDQPSRPEWGPGAGGLCLHSICPWPDEPDRLAVGISAVGVFLTEDGGRTWSVGNEGIVPRYLPEEARSQPLGRCVHNMHRSKDPERLFLQFHGGVYRSDDAGRSWTDIGNGLPADFGFPIVVDPGAADRAFVIPLNADVDRVSAEGRLRVYETGDAGSSWMARTDGLPQDAYLTILRQAFGHDGRDPLGLYFGATSGDVYASADGGASWSTVARGLAPVVSVRVAAA